MTRPSAIQATAQAIKLSYAFEWTLLDSIV